MSSDQKHNPTNRAKIRPAKLLLESPLNYLDPSHALLRKQFVNHITKMFLLSGSTQREAVFNSLETLQFETMLATMRIAGAIGSDPKGESMKITNLQNISPNIDLKYVLNEMGVTDKKMGDSPLYVFHPNYFSNLSTILPTVSISTFKAYLKYRVLKAAAPHISIPFRNENFDFYFRTLQGLPEIQPVWKSVLLAASSALRDDVSKLYVEKHFSENSKKAGGEMVNLILECISFLF